MKKKAKTAVKTRRVNWQFDSTEFLLLVFVAACLLIFFGWQTGLLSGVGPMVLGASASR